MFTEQIYDNSKTGWIEVITGSMFSGKTEELMRRLKRARIGNLSVKVFKPGVDNRYNAAKVVSHDTNSIPAMVVEKAHEIIDCSKNIQVIGIDEGQFFDNGLVDVCNQLANNGRRVIVAGLDMDYLGHPFMPMPGIIAVAEYITKVHAICTKCGNLANFSHRLIEGKGQIIVGAGESYTPLCRNCYNKVKKQQ